MTFSWDRNLARGTIFAPADPRDSLIGVYGTVCSLSPSLATRCNQKICRLARDINPEYFTFNCCKRRLVGMGRWVDMGKGMQASADEQRGGEFMAEQELEQKMQAGCA